MCPQLRVAALPTLPGCLNLSQLLAVMMVAKSPMGIAFRILSASQPETPSCCALSG